MNVLDIIGPIMIGPSSSHTAGAARIGYICRKLLTLRPVQAEIALAGSFARTYKGHGTDRAIIAGILGMKPDDDRLPDSLEIARTAGLRYEFRTVYLPRCHPNTAIIHLTGEDGTSVEVEAASVGGGNVLVTRLNGMESAFAGQSDTLIIPHRDTPGVIATVSQTLSDAGANIGNFKLTRPTRGQLAMMTIELDSEISKQTIEALRCLPNVEHVVYLHANEKGENDHA
ncbi:MAG: L-serine ammonia-lyase, iron-sulfur-dependent, subunit beta [Clostridiales bacterium]|nr:L-serine ammonia-lyase, iron-sulfur-dependent, subunit beta [Clostridiales bacterium]